jgi:phage terminase small subunit
MSGILKNQKHEIFALQIAEGKTATEAALVAGYSEKTARAQGSRLLTKADIVDRVNELRARVNEKAASSAAVSKAWVIAHLKENAERSMQAVPVVDKNGNETGEYIWNPNAANRSLELIGKELGMFVERKRITIEDLRELSTEELLALLEDVNGRLEQASESETGIVH